MGDTTRDRTGQRFGRLVVLWREVVPRGAGKKGVRTYFHCQCDCGRKSRTQSSNLIGGAAKSCGCLRTEMRSWQTVRNGALGKVISSYRWNAVKRGLAWDLTTEQALAMLRSDCFYCGVPPKHLRRSGRLQQAYYNGLDRIDNASGYTPGNVVTACFICNRAKNDLRQEDFIEWARRIAAHLRLLETPEGGEA